LREIKKPLVVPRKWKDLIQSYALLVGLAVGTAASILLSVRRREEIEALLRRIWLRVTLPVKRLLAWLLVRLGLLRRQEEAAFDIRVREPDLIPEEAAFKELDRIDALGLVGRGMIKDHYSLVSETVRRYLERKFGVLAMESPTSLTLAALGELEIGDQGYNLTVEVLDEADLVKFAKFRPDGSRVDSLLERARSLVRLTGSVPVSTNMGAY
jgi:hypothetical protein